MWVSLKCTKWNMSVRQVSWKCPTRAGCRPESHFYRIFYRDLICTETIFILNRLFVCNRSSFPGCNRAVSESVTHGSKSCEGVQGGSCAASRQICKGNKNSAILTSRVITSSVQHRLTTFLSYVYILHIWNGFLRKSQIYGWHWWGEWVFCFE